MDNESLVGSHTRVIRKVPCLGYRIHSVMQNLSILYLGNFTVQYDQTIAAKHYFLLIFNAFLFQKLKFAKLHSCYFVQVLPTLQRRES